MKEIKAIIQPYMLDKVLSALETHDSLPGVTISEVQGWGKSRTAEGGTRIPESGHSFARMTRVEIVVPDDRAAEVIEIIARTARTGKPGDGKVFLYEVTGAVKIRTGECGQDAL